MNTILAVSQEIADKGYPRYVEIPEALLYALLGFVVVFLGIAFLILIVWAVGKFMQRGEVASTSQSKPQTIKQNEKAIVPIVETVNDETISEETVAVITAAIMAYYEENNPKCEFTVKRIKRI